MEDSITNLFNRSSGIFGRSPLSSPLLGTEAYSAQLRLCGRDDRRQPAKNGGARFIEVHRHVLASGPGSRLYRFERATSLWVSTIWSISPQFVRRSRPVRIENLQRRCQEPPTKTEERVAGSFPMITWNRMSDPEPNAQRFFLASSKTAISRARCFHMLRRSDWSPRVPQHGFRWSIAGRECVQRSPAGWRDRVP